jgi:hypothetical protein
MHAGLRLQYADHVEQFSVVGLPLGPNIRIKLFCGLPSAALNFSNPIVALM